MQSNGVKNNRNLSKKERAKTFILADLELLIEEKEDCVKVGEKTTEK